jgi:hypothetical protein
MPDSSLDHKLEEMNKRMEKVERYMLWGTILSVVRTLIIVVPIVLAVIFIPPVIKKYMPFAADLVQFAQDVMKRVPTVR